MSSSEDSDHDIADAPEPPTARNLTPSILARNAMPTAPSGSSLANSNGKRPIQTISAGNDDMDELAPMTNGKARQEPPLKTHPTSGYTWTKPEDEPGYAWLNKKATDEANRAWEILQHKDRMIKNMYGDPFEIVEKEQAILASLKER